MEPQALIDELTGEIVEQDYTLEELPAIGRTIRALQQQVDEWQNYKRSEIEKIRASTDFKIERLHKQVEYLIGLANHLMGDKKKIEYPGIGCFRRRKQLPTPIREQWDAMSLDEQKAVAANYPDLFTVVEEVKPETVKIRGVVSAGQDVPGWSVEFRDDKLEFKGE